MMTNGQKKYFDELRAYLGDSCSIPDKGNLESRDTKNYLTAYNEIVGEFTNEKHKADHSYDGCTIKKYLFDKNNPDGYSGQVSCDFERAINPIEILDTKYRCECTLKFKDLTHEKIGEILNKTNYNYDLIYHFIDELYKIGQHYKVYKTLKIDKKLNLSDFFSVNTEETRSIDKERNYKPSIYAHQDNQSDCLGETVQETIDIADVTASVLFMTDSVDKIKATLIFSMEDQDSDTMHPIIELEFPYGENISYFVDIDLHPSKREEQLKNLEREKKNFIFMVSNTLNSVLNRELNLIDVDADELSLEEKLTYLPVLEMKKM